jgi:hypothetical protein
MLIIFERRLQVASPKREASGLDLEAIHQRPGSNPEEKHDREGDEVSLRVDVQVLIDSKYPEPRWDVVCGTSRQRGQRGQ